MSASLPLRTNPRPLPRSLTRTKPGAHWSSPYAKAPRGARLHAGDPVRGGLLSQPRIVSSAHGPIEQLLLCYPAYAEGEYSYRSVYEDLLRKLPEQTRFLILTHPEVADELESLLQVAGVDDRTQVLTAPSYLEFLVWAEDGYAAVHDVAYDPPRVFLLEPFTFDRYGDAIIADLIALHSDVKHLQSPLYFQGGNILVGDDFIMLGADYPVKTRRLIDSQGHVRIPAGANQDEWIRQLYQQTFDPDRRLLYVGTSKYVPRETSRRFMRDGELWTEYIHGAVGERQPIFHIDMFITLAGRGADGRYRLVVGSPKLAADLLGEALQSHALDPLFDEIAADLEGQGFQVIRAPLPLTYVDDVPTRTRTWYYASANNCLVQIDEQGQQVWLPTYGYGAWSNLAAVDEQVARVWEGLGFLVHRLTDYHPFAQNLGAVHCITKYLRR